MGRKPYSRPVLQLKYWVYTPGVPGEKIKKSDRIFITSEEYLAMKRLGIIKNNIVMPSGYHYLHEKYCRTTPGGYGYGPREYYKNQRLNHDNEHGFTGRFPKFDSESYEKELGLN